MRGDQARRATAWQHLVLDLSLNYRSKAMPAPGEVADYYDAFGREAGNDHTHAPAEIVRHLLYSQGGADIAVIGTAEQVRETQPGSFLAGLAVVTHAGAVRSKHFPAATAAASTHWTLRIERNVAEFASHGVHALHQPSVHQNAGSDAF